MPSRRRYHLTVYGASQTIGVAVADSRLNVDITFTAAARLPDKIALSVQSYQSIGRSARPYTLRSSLAWMPSLGLPTR